MQKINVTAEHNMYLNQWLPVLALQTNLHKAVPVIRTSSLLQSFSFIYFSLNFICPGVFKDL